MASNAGDIVKAHCSHCKVDVDAQVVAAVADEIVTVSCKTCGTSQRYRMADEDGGGADRGMSRRVVDVEPRKNKKPRSRVRRVGADTGGESLETPNIAGPPPSPMARGEVEPPKIPSRTPVPPVFATEDAQVLFKRWDEATDKIDSRYARPHRNHESYEVGEAVLDKIHGMGIIEAVDHESGALRVLFRRGYVQMASVPKHLRPPVVLDEDDDDDV